MVHPTVILFTLAPSPECCFLPQPLSPPPLLEPNQLRKLQVNVSCCLFPAASLGSFVLGAHGLCLPRCPLDHVQTPVTSPVIWGPCVSTPSPPQPTLHKDSTTILFSLKPSDPRVCPRTSRTRRDFLRLYRMNELLSSELLRKTYCVVS